MKGLDINTALEEMSGWVFKDGSIKKTYSFDSYMESIKFINRLAEEADKVNHHPDMLVGWCSIEITFTSHEIGGVTSVCLEMAKKADAVY
jgi:4a-hydroxytetrahydrobiopterin dehydratase